MTRFRKWGQSAAAVPLTPGDRVEIARQRVIDAARYVRDHPTDPSYVTALKSRVTELNDAEFVAAQFEANGRKVRKST